MNVSAIFREIVAVIPAPMNGATQDYTFYIKPTISINTGDIIAIQLIDTTNGTNPLNFAAGIVNCPISYSTISFNNPCSASTTTLTITLSSPLFDITGTTQYKLVVSSFVLARTPNPSSSFKFTSLTSQGYNVQT